MLVEQEIPTIAMDATLQLFHVSCTVFLVGIADVHAVVVVAHDGINPIGGMKPVEVASETVEFCTLMVDKVARKEDGIALLGVDEVNDGSYIGFVPIAQRTDVEVGELRNAVAFELGRKVCKVERLTMDDVVMTSVEIADAEDAESKESQCHGEDAEETHEDAVVVFFRVSGTTCHQPVDGVSCPVEQHEEGFRCTNGKEKEHENADPRLMLRLHIARTDDDDGSDGKKRGWKKPRQTYPPLFCPTSDVHPVDVEVGQNQHQDDE